MTTDELLEYCLTKKSAYVDFPFGELPVCVRVEGRIFAQIYPHPEERKVTLKCEPLTGDDYRRRYPGAVVRAYWCPASQQLYWYTLMLNGTVPDGALKGMVDHAYAAAVAKLPKRVQKKLSGEIMG